jgi:hypothetical protein
MLTYVVGTVLALGAIGLFFGLFFGSHRGPAGH